LDVFARICVLNALAVAGFAAFTWFSLRYGLPRWFRVLTILPGVLGSATVDAVMIEKVGLYRLPLETLVALLAYGIAWRWGRPGPSGPGSR